MQLNLTIIVGMALAIVRLTPLVRLQALLVTLGIIKMVVLVWLVMGITNTAPPVPLPAVPVRAVNNPMQIIQIVSLVRKMPPVFVLVVSMIITNFIGMEHNVARSMRPAQVHWVIQLLVMQAIIF